MSKRSFGQIPKASLRTTRSRQNQHTGSPDVSRKHYIGRVGSEAEEDLSLGCTPDHPMMKHVLHRSISPVSSFFLDHPGPSNTRSSDDDESVTAVDQSSKQYFWTILDQVTPDHPMYKCMQRRSINGHI